MDLAYRIANDIANNKEVDESCINELSQKLQESLVVSPSQNIATLYFNIMMYKIKRETDFQTKADLSMRLLFLTREYISKDFISLIEDNIGIFLEKIGFYDAAMYHYKNAWDASNAPIVANHIGNMYLKHYRCAQKARYYLSLAESEDPNDIDILNNRLLFHVNQKDYTKALEYGEQLMKQRFSDPKKHASVFINIASIYASINKPHKSLETLEISLQIHPSPIAHTQRIFLLLHDPSVTMQHILSEHKRWIPRLYKTPLSFIKPVPMPSTPLRIGIVSGELFDHPIIDFVRGILEGLDRYRFYISFFLGNTKHTERAKKEFPMIDWRSVSDHVPCDSIADDIRKKCIDLLIDLDGHTSKNRLDVFAMSAAPVQVTYLGYPGTTGLSTIDYRITDRLCDGPETEDKYTEKLAYMPSSFLLYTPRANLDISPSFSDRFFRIGFTNRLNKANDRVLSLWLRIIKEVPSCKLLIKSSDFSIHGQKEQLLIRLNVLANGNWNRERVEFVNGTTTYEEHLSFYNEIDMSIDPFPYTGTTSTCEALYMGVPVVTLRPHASKRCHQHEVSAAILEHSGLETYVSHDEDEYVDIIRRASAEHASMTKEEKTKKRRFVRDSFLNGPVCNKEVFVRDFSDLLEKMAKRRI